MAIELPELPFAYDALQPHLSEETVRLHYLAVQASQVARVNALTTGTELEFRPLKDILQIGSGRLLANAAEAWNHSFLWNCLKPGGSHEPHGPLAAVLKQQFGSVDSFERQFSDAAISLFGCGWVWLVKDINGELEVLPDNNPSTSIPWREALTPVLACDVWEHAYYLDYRNNRDQYLDAFWRLVNWDFVAEQYQRDPRVLQA